MAYLFKRIEWRCSDSVGWTVGPTKFGIVLFESAKSPQKRIILSIRDQRVVFSIIEKRVLGQDLDKILYQDSKLIRLAFQ
jgi:hypothetical protein